MISSPSRCARCGELLVKGFRHCPQCGTPCQVVPDSRPGNEPATPATRIELAQPRNFVCAKCGTNFPSTYERCPACEKAEKARPQVIMVIAVAVAIMTVTIFLMIAADDWFYQPARPPMMTEQGGTQPLPTAPPPPSEVELPKSYGLYERASGGGLLMVQTQPADSPEYRIIPIALRHPVFIWFGRSYQSPKLYHLLDRSRHWTAVGNFIQVEVQVTPKGQDLYQIEPYGDLPAGAIFSLRLFSPSEMITGEVFWFSTP